ncbi:MAG: DUF1588 domain-containing protein [Kiritimatiellia bacterium]
MRKAMQAALVSPNFLFVTDPDAPAPGVHPVDPFVLASRLSFFLWRTMPTTNCSTPRRRARSPPRRASRQARRLLADPRAAVFAQDSRGRRRDCKGTRRLRLPSRALRNTHEVQQAMIAEAEPTRRPHLPPEPTGHRTARRAVHLRQPRPRRLLRHARRGVRRRARSNYPTARRRRITTLGAVMAVTSYPIRTSPVKRGKWLLEQVLGQPPPPPPPDAGFLPAADKVEAA